MKILLHICCANCAIFPIRVMRERNQDLTGFFYNNNIHPYQEFKRRLDTVKEYAGKVELDVIYNESYMLREFLENVAKDPDKRCDYCYRSRLEQTAQYAADNGFDAFTTSLLYSRYQQHDRIRSFGEDIAERYDLKFYYEDFRSGWQDGIATSKNMGLYRQQYCGCIYSEMDRYYPQKRN
jgi:predicted adenine nucleotide alpha hydrolase (AANH) superfamily ATPase